MSKKGSKLGVIAQEISLNRGTADLISPILQRKFERIEQILAGVGIAVVMGLIAIIIAVVGLFLDQMRYNNAAYKEYSEKIESLEELKESNKMLLQQNSDYQELILEQQTQIIELLQK